MNPDVDFRDIVHRFGTPVFVLDAEALRSNCRRFRTAFECSGLECEFLYAVKANFEPAVLRIVAEEKYGALVGSDPEGRLAEEYGFSKHLMLYTPCLIDSEIRYAIRHSIPIVADSRRDLQRIAHMGRRLGDIPVAGLRYDPEEDERSKFGVTAPEFMKAARFFSRSRNLRFTTLSVHLGTQLTKVATYRNAIRGIAIMLSKLSDSLGTEFSKISLGGGFTGNVGPNERLIPIERTASTIVKEFREEFAKRKLVVPTLIVEPGRFLVNDAIKCLGTIHSVKGKKGGRSWAYCDLASSFLPNLNSARYAFSTIDAGDRGAAKFDIGGPIGMEHDVVMRGARLPGIREGAIVVVSNCGAYTLSLASNFNRPKPPLVTIESGRARLERSKGAKI